LDVYHGLSNELPVNIRNFKGKKIVTIHDLIFLRYPDYYPFIDRYIYKKKFQMACQMADVVIATSQQTADDINFFFGTPPSKIKVIYQSCDERYAIKVDADSKDAVRQRYLLPPKFFLSVGTFEQRKQQIRMVQAFSKMKHSDDSLILIGKKTPYVDELRKVIHQYDLNHRIKILHHVPNEDLPALYSLAHAFIFASEYEGFGIPVLEALQTGTPLIVSHSSSLPEVAGKAAFYFPPHDTDALADLMNKVSDENFDREAFHEERMAQLLHFSKEALSKQLFEVYTH
jgi:glycosyltransferase involved in cell wall biosynthesis